MVNAYAALSAKGRLEPFQYEPGPLGRHEVEVKPTHCGICHSDIAMIDDEWGFSTYPVVPGHEVIGHVTAVGPQVDTVQVGQRVGVGWQCGSCGRCEWCGRGLESLCAQNQPTIVHHHGGWADSVRTQAKFATPIPDGLDSADAAPLMCAGTTVFTPMVRYGVKPWMKAAVVGIGGLGHLAVQYLAAFGCEVTAISSSHDKDEATRRLGATELQGRLRPREQKDHQPGEHRQDRPRRRDLAARRRRLHIQIRYRLQHPPAHRRFQAHPQKQPEHCAAQPERCLLDQE